MPGPAAPVRRVARRRVCGRSSTEPPSLDASAPAPVPRSRRADRPAGGPPSPQVSRSSWAAAERSAG